MSDLKYTIGVLCKLLNLLLDTNIRIDHFKFAKHNKGNNNVVICFWHTLNQLTIKCTYNIVDSLKKHMLSIKYNDSNFQSLPQNMSSGSKELLLAIAYVLPERLEILVDEVIKNSPCHQDYDILDTAHEDISFYNSDPQYSIQFYKWIKGKLKQTRSQVVEYTQQNKKITRTLQKLCRKKSDENLSDNEILAYSSKKILKEYMERTELVLNILENYTFWKRKEDYFWAWMETVLRQENEEK